MSKKIQYFLAFETPRTGHTSGVNAMAYNPTLNLLGDGPAGTLFTGGGDGRINAWSSTPTSEGTSAAKRACDVHTNWVTDLIRVNDNVVSCSSDTTVRMWDPKADVYSFVGSHTDYAQCLASPSTIDPSFISSGGLDGHIKGWDTSRFGDDTAKPLFDFSIPGVTGSVYSLAASTAHPGATTSRDLLVSGSSDSIIRLWDPREKSEVSKLRGHTRNVKSLLFNGELIISGSADGTMKLWSLTAGKLMRTYTNHNASIWTLYSDSSDFSSFYSGDKTGELRHNVRTDLEISSKVACQQEKGITSMAIVDDDKYIWTSSLDKVLYRWPNKPEDNTPNEPLEVIKGGECLLARRLLNDKRRVLVTLSNGIVKMVDIMKGRVVECDLPRLDLEKDISDQMDEIAESVNTLDVLENWCQVSIRAGQLCIMMEERSFANTEVYVDDIQDQGEILFTDVDSEKRINLGKWMLINIFRTFQEAEVEKCRRRIERHKANAASASAAAGVEPTRELSRSVDTSEGSTPRSSDKPKFLQKLFSSRKNRLANEDYGSSPGSPRVGSVGSPMSDAGLPPKTETSKPGEIKGPLPTDYLSLVNFVVANERLNPPSKEAYPDLHAAPDTRIFISESIAGAGASTVDFQCRMSQLNDKRITECLGPKLPMWVGRVLLENTIPSRTVNKVGFSLIPYQGEDAPTISTEKTRLMAHPVLRTKKVMGYVIKALLTSKYLKESEVKGVDPEEVCDLYCNGKLLNTRMTLATIRTRIWRSGGDVIINYKLKEPFIKK